MRLIDADKLYPDCLTKTCRLAISQSQISAAPIVEYTFEEAFQKTVCEQRLYCPERPQGEWIIDGHHRRCKKCGEYFCMADIEGNEIPSNFCPNCGAKMQKGSVEE